MKLQKGKSYTNDRTDLQIKILQIHYESTDYYKVRIVLSNKKNGIIYEMKNIKLMKDGAADWYEVRS